MKTRIPTLFMSENLGSGEIFFLHFFLACGAWPECRCTTDCIRICILTSRRNELHYDVVSATVNYDADYAECVTDFQVITALTFLTKEQHYYLLYQPHPSGSCQKANVEYPSCLLLYFCYCCEELQDAKDLQKEFLDKYNNHSEYPAQLKKKTNNHVGR